MMLPAQSLLSVPHPSGEAQLFETDDDLVAPEGGGTLSVGITAVVEGAAGNGCFGEAELVDVLEGIELVEVPAPPPAAPMRRPPRTTWTGSPTR